MSLGILTNVAATYAENNLNQTQGSLQTVLQQLSSGSRINSGADDAAGLSVADGLRANEAALTQSAQNAQNGVGLLQTADGALSQVTNLLDRAMTLATEASNGGLTTAQSTAADTEFQSIITEIGNIGGKTNFNSTAVFSATATNFVVSDGTTAGTTTIATTIGALTSTSIGGVTFAPAADTLTTAALAEDNADRCYQRHRRHFGATRNDRRRHQPVERRGERRQLGECQSLLRREQHPFDQLRSGHQRPGEVPGR